jgi:hypothetical protein
MPSRRPRAQPLRVPAARSLEFSIFFKSTELDNDFEGLVKPVANETMQAASAVREWAVGVVACLRRLLNRPPWTAHPFDGPRRSITRTTTQQPPSPFGSNSRRRSHEVVPAADPGVRAAAQVGAPDEAAAPAASRAVRPVRAEASAKARVVTRRHDHAPASRGPSARSKSILETRR